MTAHGDDSTQAEHPIADGGFLRLMCTVVLLLAFAIAWSGRTPNSDLYMALAGGRDVAEGKLGKPDDWSYLTQGRVWINQSWLTGYVLYLVHSVAGDGGLLAARTALLAAFAAGLMAWLRRRGASWSTAALAAAAVLLVCRYHLLLRGNLVTIALTPWLLVLLDRQARGSAHWAWIVAVLLGVWAHCHGGHVFGFFVVGLWLVAHAPAAIRRRGGWSPARWISLAVAAGAALGSAVLLSPFGTMVVKQSLAMTGDSAWRTVKEWWPLVRGWSEFWSELGQGVSEIGSFCILLAAATILCVRATWRVGRRRMAAPDQGEGVDVPGNDVPAGDVPAVHGAAVWSLLAFDLMLVAVVVAMAFVGRRFVPLAAIALAWPLAWSVDALRRPVAARATAGSGGAADAGRPASWPCWLSPIAAAMGLAMLAYPTLVLGYRADHPFYPNQTIEQRQIVAGQFPIAAARFLRDNELRGPVWHTYQHEGCLRWLAPHVQVGCGGRAQQVYGEDDLKRARAIEDLRFLQRDAMVKRQQAFERYGIRLILLPATQSWELIVALIGMDWTPVFFDGEQCLLMYPVGGYEVFQAAVFNGSVAIIDPASDPDGARARAEIGQGRVVYPDELTWTRSRAMFMTSPRLSSDDIPEADMFKLRAGWIDAAQKITPTPHLYAMLDRLSAARRTPDRALMNDYFEAERARLAQLPDSGAGAANVLICRSFVASILARHARLASDERRAVMLDDATFAAEAVRTRLGFWWQM